MLSQAARFPGKEGRLRVVFMSLPPFRAFAFSSGSPLPSSLLDAHHISLPIGPGCSDTRAFPPRIHFQTVLGFSQRFSFRKFLRDLTTAFGDLCPAGVMVVVCVWGGAGYPNSFPTHTGRKVFFHNPGPSIQGRAKELELDPPGNCSPVPRGDR